jgi:hypothetical protein
MREEGRGKGEGVAGDNRRPLAPSLSGSSAARSLAVVARPLAVVTYVPVAAFRLRPPSSRLRSAFVPP